LVFPSMVSLAVKQLITQVGVFVAESSLFGVCLFDVIHFWIWISIHFG